MDQLNDFADDRLLNGCVYCGGLADTRDHVPSRCLLERPYPENLPVVGCCDSCNQSFSRDEEYFVCLIESVLCRSTNHEDIGRPSVARKLERSPALKARIENAKSIEERQVTFVPEWERVINVMLKLARGHAAFELSQPCRGDPDHFWCGPLGSLPQNQRDAFDAAHVLGLLGEVGSRNSQRLLVKQVTLQSESGDQRKLNFLANDWLDVQDGLYRYLAIDDAGGLVIRIIVSEYFACEVAWQLVPV